MLAHDTCILQNYTVKLCIVSDYVCKESVVSYTYELHKGFLLEVLIYSSFENVFVHTIKALLSPKGLI